MTDIRKLALVGLASLGLITFGSVGCSSSGGGGTGGSTGTGGTSSGTGGTSSGTGGTSSGTGGTGGGGGAVVGCAMSDAPASADIASFATADGGVAAMFGTFTYGDTPKPTFTIGNGMVNVTDTVQIDSKNHYQGFGIYFNGNAAGTDCLDAHAYTGVQFDISGSLTGTGCTMQFSINDSEHTNPESSSPADVKASGTSTSYSPQLTITSADLTSTTTTLKVPFAMGATGAPSGGSPATAIDPTKLEGVQWQMSVPLAADGGATECVWNFNIANVKFYN